MQMHALVVTTDKWLGSIFCKAALGIGVEARIVGNARAASEQVGRAKYDTIVVDFDTIPEALHVLALLRTSPSNRKIVVFAVATDKAQKARASRDGASVLLHRPIDMAQVTRGLSAGHGPMLIERRRYFRCGVAFPVSLTRPDSAMLQCTATNVSTSGMGIETTVTMRPGEKLRISFTLPGGSNVRAIGTVVWDDGHGKTGLRFESISSHMQSALDAWLDVKFSAGGSPHSGHGAQ